MKKLLFGVLFLLGLVLPLYPFSLKDLYHFKTERNTLILGFRIENFPLQEVLLALKAHQREVTLLCEVELFRKRFLLRDEPLSKFVFFKRAGFNPERNLYYLEDNQQELFFESPEELVKDLVNFDSLSLDLSLPEEGKDYYLILQVKLRFYSHLNPKLRYTSKEKEYLYQTEKRYEPFK